MLNILQIRCLTFDPKCDIDLHFGLVHGISSHDGLHFYYFVLKSSIDSGHDIYTSEPMRDLDDPSVTLTLQTWTMVLRASHRLMVVNICIKYF